MTYNKPNYKKVVFVSDIHAPYHDIKAVNACIAFIKWYKPHTVVIMGDAVDFYAVSSFSKDPVRATQLQDEIDVTVDILSQFRKSAPRAKFYFLKGNHEHRLQRYLWTKASELSGLRDLKVPHLLSLDKLKMEYVETGVMKMQGTFIKHGNIVRKYSGYSANGEFQLTGMSGVSAHTHRICSFYHSNEAGNFVWIETGCLADCNPEYMEGKTPNWQQGFGIGFYKNSGSSRFNLDIVPIVNGKAMFGGMEFK